MSDRFYVEGSLASGDIRLEGPEAHHLVHVRRFGIGDRVVLFNGDGHDYQADIAALDKKSAQLRIVSIAKENRELGRILHIASALPKGDRGDFLIEKLTELGATDFTPLVTVRSIVHPKAKSVEKLQRAVIEASKQCGRNVLLRVHPPCRFESWLKSDELPEKKWILHPDGSKLEATAKAADLAVAIGPEGGFTHEEVSIAWQSGFEPVSLGPRILRVETAALAIAAWFGLTG